MHFTLVVELRQLRRLAVKDQASGVSCPLVECTDERVDNVPMPSSSARMIVTNNKGE
jgi:hypothetical protein